MRSIASVASISPFANQPMRGLTNLSHAVGVDEWIDDGFQRYQNVGAKRDDDSKLEWLVREWKGTAVDAGEREVEHGRHPADEVGAQNQQRRSQRFRVADGNRNRRFLVRTLPLKIGEMKDGARKVMIVLKATIHAVFRRRGHLNDTVSLIYDVFHQMPPTVARRILDGARGRLALGRKLPCRRPHQPYRVASLLLMALGDREQFDVDN